MAQLWQRGHLSFALTKALGHQICLQESIIFAVTSSTPIHSLNPLQSTFCPHHSPNRSFTKVTGDLSSEKPIDTIQPLLDCPLCNTWCDDYSFFPKIVSSPRSTIIFWFSFSLTVCFSGPLFLGWSRHCWCSVLGFLSISFHIFSWGPYLLPSFQCHLDGGGCKIFNLQPWLVPEPQIRVSKCLLEAQLATSLLTSGSRAKLNLSSFLPRHTIFCHVYCTLLAQIF